MKTLAKVLESKAKIRFQDCDPFNHLNNANYINYMINAREDQIEENYQLDIFKLVKTQGKAWVVGSNQIAYLKPALVMETVTIDSQLIRYDQNSLTVEIKMWNEAKSELKAVLWSTFVHFDLLKQKRTNHSEDFMQLFENVVNSVSSKSFEERILQLKPQKV
ncbi:acyl-CoA thioesterase [Aquimarina rhabdastrellae]